MKTKKSDLNRRAFIGTVAVAGATWIAHANQRVRDTQPMVTEKAQDGPVLKAGLVGCGGRGGGRQAISLTQARTSR